MTPGELKFALHVETWLNRLPHPEYRQLMVECLMVLAIVVRQDPGQRLGDILNIDSLVYEANALFLEDLVSAAVHNHLSESVIQITDFSYL